MDLTKLLAELREEADRINQAIDAVERIVRASGKRRGRPPKWVLAQKPAVESQAKPPAK